MKRIGILTGGGDVPGLNAVIKTIVRRMAEHNVEVVGLRKGWASLVSIRDEHDIAEWTMPLNPANTRRIDRFGGTILHSSRWNPARLLARQVPPHILMPAGGTIDMTTHVLETIERLELDVVVAIGGDGTLDYALRLHEEGVPILAIPKTMDNDVYGTDYCLGFSTAVTRSVELIQRLRTAAGSHERIMVVEIFGRYSGEPCLLAAYLSAADRCLIAEVPFDTERVLDLIVADKKANPSSYSILAVAEGAHPTDGRRLEGGRPDSVGRGKLGGIGRSIADTIEAKRGQRTLYQALGYLIRTGTPDSLDQLVAKNFGHLAADLLEENRTGLMATVADGRYATQPIGIVRQGKRGVDVERYYDSENYRARMPKVVGMPLFLH